MFERLGSLGSEAVRMQAHDLLTRCFAPSALGGLYEGPERLREDCLYPAFERVVPHALRITVAGRPAGAVVLPEAVISNLACHVGEWSLLSRPPRCAAARVLWDALLRAEALCDEAESSPLPARALTLVGHATVLFARDGQRLLFDPYFPPERNPHPSYRPLSPRELAPSALFITHSHPDHFDVGSLLRFGADTPIFVPRVERESLLSVAMAARLSQLGFSRVRELAWGESVSFGPYRVTALPFWGEQPTDGSVLHPDVNNAGNTYRVDDGTRSFVLLADAGRDRRGDVREMLSSLHAAGQRADVVLGGYRAFRLHPAQYLTSSVARYLLFVPRSFWQERFAIMNDTAALFESARAIGARYVVPYANGGAPWYWDNGLGPRLDAMEHESDPDFDPQFVAQASPADAARVTPLELHPGEGLDLDAGVPVVSAPSAQRWPFARPSKECA